MVHCSELQVNSPNTIWEHFLNGEQHFGWRGVRLKSTQSGQADEFMLVSKERREAFGQDYELIRSIQ